ncbi:MAG: peptidoglycan DD-metalloendopeptidase family protein [Rubrivivax sp.]
MGLRRARMQGWVWMAVLMVGLAGCSSPSRKAPVEDRSAMARPVAPAAAAPAPPAAAVSSEASLDDASKSLSGAENAGKPGYYTVKPGDTLIRIALDSGQNWRDVARWNGLDNPNLVEVGQVLRVVAPNVDAGATTARAVAGAGRVDTRPLDAKPLVPAATTASAATAAPAAPTTSTPAVAASAVTPGVQATSTAPVAAVAPPVAAPGAPRDPADDVVWAWPAAGAVIAGFDEGRNKGLTIAGKAGDPVLAAGDGRVVYAGSSLRGYGNLVIVKHSEVFLTAYAHNQTLLVKDDQAVRRGQKIAEMGSSDAERVQLHFEIRRQGKPIDPAKLLPNR